MTCRARCSRAAPRTKSVGSSRAVAAMVAELRRLAIALGSSAQETSAMSAEITAGTEEMAASAGEIAHTASDLSQQSTGMAQSIQLLSTSAEQLVRIAGELRDGAHEGVSRNEQLRGLSLESRTKLDESSKALEVLAKDVRASASAIEGLATASLEVRSFVTLVQKLARQSKLLALNAAMEAARAGEHGQGFAVVASEVRRLAAMSSEAAQRTEQVMGGVLRGIDESRASSERSVSTVRQVLEATEHGVALLRRRRGSGSEQRRMDDRDRARGDIGEFTRRRNYNPTHATQLRHRVVRRSDAAGRGIERGAEREHTGNRRGRRRALERRRAIVAARRELTTRVIRRTGGESAPGTNVRPASWAPHGTRPESPSERCERVAYSLSHRTTVMVFAEN